MRKKSTSIALGGMFSALCVTLMFMTGLMPFATYAFPMLAGALLIPIIIELGAGSAVAVYVSVSLLSILVVVDKEAALMFTVFFGYYPILKQRLDRVRPRVLGYLCKLAVFNGSVVAGFAFVAHLLGFYEILEGFGEFGKYSVLIFLAAGNLVFVIYDIALMRYYGLYLGWFRPRFLRR